MDHAAPESKGYKTLWHGPYRRGLRQTAHHAEHYSMS